jgi:hypothetical protein
MYIMGMVKKTLKQLIAEQENHWVGNLVIVALAILGGYLWQLMLAIVFLILYYSYLNEMVLGIYNRICEQANMLAMAVKNLRHRLWAAPKKLR